MVLPFKKIMFISVMAFFSSVLAAGCGNKEAQQKPVSPPIKIAVSVADMERDGNKIIKKVMDGRKKNDRVEITWLDAKNDSRQQSQQLEKLAGQRIQAVVLQPVNPADGPELMQKLVENNIKVVSLETLPVDAPVDAYIASNHSLTGRLMAEFVINSVRKSQGIPVAPGEPGTAGDLQAPQEKSQQGGGQQGGQAGQQGGGGGNQGGEQGGGGNEGGQQGGGQAGGQNGGQGGGGQPPGGTAAIPPEAQLAGRSPASVVLLSGDPRDIASQEIAAAARAVLRDSQWARLVGEYEHPQGDPALVPYNMQQALAATNNGVEAVLATDSRLAVAAVDVLKAAGLNNRVLTVGVGADEKASQALAAGEHDAEVDTRPDLLGQYALDAAINLAKNDHWEYSSQTVNGGYSVPSRITPVRLIQSENIYLLNQRWEGMKGGEQGGGGKGQQQGGQQGQQDQQGQEDQQGKQNQQGQQGQQGQGGQQPKTMLKITTMDGKTMEVEINGEVKKIESMNGGQGQQGQQQGQGGGQGQGGQ